MGWVEHVEYMGEMRYLFKLINCVKAKLNRRFIRLLVSVVVKKTAL